MRRSALSPALPVTQSETGPSERRVRILDAAERVFARAGFHGATMNDVAAEAGMSPGNLYRYFDNKDAIIAGMVERDRTEIAADFAGLESAKGPLLDQLEALGRRHLVDSPNEKAVIALQIWAEAARNPGIAHMCACIEGAVVDGLAAAISAAKAAGELPADLDETRFLQTMSMMADGFFCRRAIEPHFDLKASADTLFTAMRGLSRIMLLPPADAASA